MSFLHVRRSGSGQPLVLLHGVAGSGAIWETMTPPLSADFEVWRLDLLGYGYSPKPKIRYTVEAQLEAIHRTLHEQNISQPYAIAGLSMGAILALEYAAAYPKEVSSVVAIGLPYFESDDEARTSMCRSFWTRVVLEHPLVARTLIQLGWRMGRHVRWIRAAFAPRFYADQITKEVMMATYRSFSSNLKDIMVAHRVGPALSRLSVPVLFIHGEADKWTPIERLRTAAKQVKPATVKLIPGAPHNLVVLNPIETATLCREFILEVLAKAS